GHRREASRRLQVHCRRQADDCRFLARGLRLLSGRGARLRLVQDPSRHPRLDEAGALAAALEGPLRADAGPAHQAVAVSLSDARAGPASARRAWQLATGGLIATAAVGIGRFIYTPILPPMADGLHLAKGEAGLIASANFLGYLAGALAAASSRLRGSPRAWLLGALAISAA